MLSLCLAAALSAPPTIVVSVHSSIEASLGKEVGEDAPALGNQVARLLRWRGDINKNVHPGDKLRLLYERAPGPELVAMVYEGSEINLRAYRFEDGDKIARFFDEAGVLVEPRIKNPPIDGYVQITELVQSGRGKRKHKGLDFKAPEGRPIILPFDGVVSRVNWGSRRSNGNCVEVRYGNGTLGRFLHLSVVDEVSVPGARLTAGTQLGLSGNTGHSVAPHLHYEIRNGADEPLDPLKQHGTTRGQVSEALKPAFAAARADLDRRLNATSTAPTGGAAPATASRAAIPPMPAAPTNAATPANTALTSEPW